tara:strand:- start:32 stop:226 length:195 start_codon:yes stop_codon:yes gene_type:complete
MKTRNTPKSYGFKVTHRPTLAGMALGTLAVMGLFAAAAGTVSYLSPDIDLLPEIPAAAAKAEPN